MVRAGAALGAAVLLVAGAASPAVAAPTGAPSAKGGSAPLVIETSDGAVRGALGDGVRTFEGIPFAAPPVDDLRFQPPAPVEPWDGVRDATEPGSQCAQLTRQANPETFGEDCLFLNVTTPAGKSAKGLPVMVWIHGGSWVYGTGANYDASKLAAQGDVVVVTINYRLGPLGFLANPALSAERPQAGSGDYALLDQQAALRWVQDNAKAFGGNPNNVTLFGESAGASSVCANLVSPTAAGLFDRAIAQSYSCGQSYATQETAEAAGARLAAAVGCTDPATAAACLRETSSEALLRAWRGGSFVVGGQHLPLQPAEAIATDRYNHVKSVMHGNTLEENTLFAPLTYGFAVTPAQYEAIVTRLYGANAPAVLAEYPVSAYPAPIYALADLSSDKGSALSTCEHVQAYDLLTDPPRPTKTFAYQFQDRTASPLIDFPGFEEGAGHATELPYLFPGLFGAPLDAAQERLSDTMVAYWTSFAKTGNPDTSRETPRWSRYRQGSGVVQALALESQGGVRPVDVATDSNCDLFASFER